MSLKIVEMIRSRTREEWIKLLRDRWLDLRIFVQENGELGFIAAFISGIMFIVFFKFLISLLILLALTFFLIWNIAEPAAQKNNQETDKN